MLNKSLPVLAISRPATPDLNEDIFAGGSEGLPVPTPKAQPWKKWAGIDPTANKADDGSINVSIDCHDSGNNGLGGY